MQNGVKKREIYWGFTGECYPTLDIFLIGCNLARKQGLFPDVFSSHLHLFQFVALSFQRQTQTHTNNGISGTHKFTNAILLWHACICGRANLFLWNCWIILFAWELAECNESSGRSCPTGTRSSFFFLSGNGVVLYAFFWHSARPGIEPGPDVE